jgi:uncharacterized repeat protein (TIGR01451 family)
LAVAIAALWLNGSAAWAAGSANLWPSGAAGNRGNSEWRTDSYGGGIVTRRTLLHVYAQAGEVILMGSTARGVVNGATTGDILAYNPGQVTGPVGTETVPAPASAAFSCNAQAAGVGAPANQGRILTRAAELAGPDTIPVGGVPSGYPPCYYLAPATGIYSVVITGPSGFSVAADGGISADVALAAGGDFSAGQGSSIAGWDVTVRSTLPVATGVQTGRVFTYYLALFTGGNGRPVNSVVYASTSDGYRYSIDLRGIDPNGWVSYGNQVGFLDSDGTSPLYHDAVALGVGSPGQLTTIAGGVQFARPAFPLFFELPSNATLTALGIPTTPIAPVISVASFGGNVSGNTSTVSSGGTFTYASNVSGIFDFVISADGVNFDPTLPANRRLRGIRPAGTQTVIWDGRDNVGTPFPVGSYVFHASVHGGEYHFPFIDVENSTAGGPTITLLNPPGACPPWTGGCKGAFYDDRAYRTLNGTVVDSGNTVGNTLCGLNPPATNHSDPLLGFDTSSALRAFGANPGINTNFPCTGSFGDAKGLDLWTYTPSLPLSNTVNIVAPAADIGVTKTVNNPAPSVGSSVTFTVTATNHGPDAANGVAVSDLLPAGLTYVSSVASAGSYVAGTGVWTVGALANGASATLQITAIVGSGAPITNTATKSAETEGDPNPANNSASVTLNPPSADLGLTKTVSSATPATGTNVTFTVTVTNHRPDGAAGVQVADRLPSGLAFVSAIPSQGTYDPVSGTWNVGSLANSAAATLRIVATVTGTTPVTNTAVRSAGSPIDPVLANDSASVQVTGSTVPGLPNDGVPPIAGSLSLLLLPVLLIVTRLSVRRLRIR